MIYHIIFILTNFRSTAGRICARLAFQLPYLIAPVKHAATHCLMACSPMHRSLHLNIPGCGKLALLTLLLLLTACDFIGDSNTRLKNAVVDEFDHKTVEWTDLMPEADLEALLNPPAYLFDVEEGSAEDQQLFDKLTSGTFDDQADRYTQALLSTDVRSEFNGERIRIAGYLVPLEFDTPDAVTQAFLVPYFGACIHVPPPPPNQIILLNTDEGLNLSDMYNPYWVSGEVSTVLHENDVATSAYAMSVTDFELYTE